MLDTTPAELVKALAKYKKQYGSTASIDNAQLETIIKEIREDNTIT
jgi:hypothetical protein